MREQLGRLQSLLGCIDDWVIALDMRGIVLYSNGRSHDFVGREPQALIGRPFDECLVSDDRESFRKMFDRVDEGLSGERMVVRIAGKSPDPKFEVTWHRIGESEDSQAVCLIIRDSTHASDDNGVQGDSDAILRSIMESSADYIMLTDLEGRIRFINRTVSDLTIADALGTTIFDHIEPSSHDRIRKCLQNVARTGQPDRYDVDYYNSNNGLEHSFEARVSPVMEDGQVVALTIIATDLTDRKRVEEELRQQQARMAHVGRLSAMGEMVAGIAHELNQPLAAIANFAGACRRVAVNNQVDHESMIHWLEQISAAANRSGTIIRRLRSFVDKSNEKRGPCDLDRIIQESIALMASELRRRRVDLQYEGVPDKFYVNCDDVQIEQVLVNLLKNACDVFAEHDTTTSPMIRIEIKSTDDDVEVAVIDNGPGIPDSIGSELFGRFVTTKSNGMGMGLAISRTIVEAHHGQPWMESNHPHGAVFRFTLPLDRR